MNTPRIRFGLMREVIVMALDTVRTNKLRSGLTVLGVVIGITSIVAMTALIRGFDQSLEETIRVGLGTNTIFLQRFGITSFASGREFSELIKRPVLTEADARALEEESTTLQYVNIEFGRGPGPAVSRRVSYGGASTRPVLIFGTTEFFAQGTGLHLVAGRFLSGPEIQRRSNVAVLGHTAYEVLFAEKGLDPVGKRVRLGTELFEVVGVFGPAPSPGNLNVNQDNFVVVPYTTYKRVFGLRVVRNARGLMQTPVQFSIVPAPGVSQADALAEIESIMRRRHRLRLDEPNDFDLVTQDALMQVWDQISQATLFALIVISSIALMVGGIGVMAIMSISVTERTREIGVRRALGARRREVLFQFLTEAAVLTSVGGVLGILLGSALGIGVHFITGFPISLPVWSFAIGLGFSATVGLIFGMYPAIRAARLDPIEALRHE